MILVKDKGIFRSDHLRVVINTERQQLTNRRTIGLDIPMTLPFSGKTHLPDFAARDVLKTGAATLGWSCPRCVIEGEPDSPLHLCPRAVLDLDAVARPQGPEQPPPAMAAILEALSLESHDNLCGCDPGPDACLTPAYADGDAFASSGYAERVLELALTAGWAPPGGMVGG